jgi:hypothetical protein
MIRQKISGRKLAILNGKREERGCLVTGIRRMYGHNVSNSNVKTPKIFKQNISQILKQLYLNKGETKCVTENKNKEDQCGRN